MQNPPRNVLCPACTALCCCNRPAGSLLASQAWQDFSNPLLLPRGAARNLAGGAWELSHTVRVMVFGDYMEAASLNVPR